MAYRLLFLIQIVFLSISTSEVLAKTTNNQQDQRKGAELKVISPSSVSQQFENRQIPSTMINLGQMNYGSALNALVYLPPNDNHACVPLPNHLNGHHIVLVYGGDCPIATKVQNIQAAGGAMALIAHEVYTPDYEQKEQQVAYKHMDTTTMQIPSLLISKEDGKILAEAFKRGEKIRINSKFEVSDSNQTIIEVTLWYGTFLDLSHKLIQELYDFVHLLQKNIVFTPRIITFECPNCIEEIKQQSCFSNGTYCLIPPKDEIAKDYPVLSDKALLEQSLLERCIHEEIKKKGKEKDDIRFFNYIYNLRYECLNLEWDLTIGCSERVMAELGIDVFSVAYCTSNSFDYYNTIEQEDWTTAAIDFDIQSTDNKLLREDRVLAELYGVSKHPSITINGIPYNGEMSGYEIYKAICSSFQPKNRPEQCEENFDVQLELGHAMEDFKQPNRRPFLFVAVFMIFAFNLLLWVCYRRYQSKKMQDVVREQVQGSVNHYMQLQDTSIDKDSQL